ncbi:DsbA family protein [Demetria terragena]|uniref:DsbA family protein n=1 Tax=Demetria terragena TaxID=63959 RepID=UPI0003795AEF|nr:thioredoxin domain-containing protein [Demetria terragena]
MPRPDASAKLSATKPPQGPSKVLIGAVIAVVLIIVGGIAWLRTDPFAGPAAAAPQGGVAGGKGVVMYPGKAKAGAPVVDLYEDFQCPICGQLEQANGKSMTEMAKAGDIKLVVHTMSFLDGNLGNDSSARAANAASCAADAGAFPEYHAAVFAAQPEKEGNGYSDKTLKAAAQSAGIKGKKLTTFTQCVDKGSYGGYVEDTQKAAEEAGVNGSPQIKVDGESLDEAQMRTLIEKPNSFSQILKQAS